MGSLDRLLFTRTLTGLTDRTRGMVRRLVSIAFYIFPYSFFFSSSLLILPLVFSSLCLWYLPLWATVLNSTVKVITSFFTLEFTLLLPFCPLYHSTFSQVHEQGFANMVMTRSMCYMNMLKTLCYFCVENMVHKHIWQVLYCVWLFQKQIKMIGNER